MTIGDQILLVVSILEGKKFPSRARHKILVETKFDGETLSTDPIDHVEAPKFTTELAWELNKKSLHKHRLHRSPIKVQCYAVDVLTSQKEPVGYIILDLRSAQQKPEVPHWYPLLSSKYQKLKPELKVLLSLEEDSQSKEADNQPFGADNTKAAASKQKDLQSSGFVGDLEPVLNNNEGYYQIGPSEKDNHIFVLSVTIGLASNLAKLIPSSFKLTDHGGGFYFYYSLIGNDVSNAVFHDLLQPNFPPERATVRIKCNIAALHAFFNAHRGLEIHLCSGDQSLGMALVPLQSLLQKDLQLQSPAVVEGLFKLQPMGAPHGMSSDDNVPAVGVSVSLKQESPVLAGTNQQPKETPSRSPATKTDLKSVVQGVVQDSFANSPSNRPISSTPEKAAHKMSDEHTVQSTSPIKYSKRHPKKPDKHQTPSPVHLQYRDMQPENTHHYCFSIDLRTINDLDVTSSINCFLRYTYPFFGSAAPVMTSPPVEVSKHMQALLPKSFCAFDFASSPKLLQEKIIGDPLIVEVWHRDQMAGNVLLGTATVNLGHILTADKMLSGGVAGYRQIYSERTNIVTAHQPMRKIGELHIVLGLEDFGPVNPQQLHAARQNIMSLSSTASSLESTSQGSSAIPLAQPQRIPPLQSEPPAVTDPRATAEYQAAMELELWKEHQEEMFQSQLQQKETEHIKTLAEDWKRRDKERELLVKKKVEEYAKLEEKLRLTVADFEKREKQLASNELHVAKLKEDLQHEHDKKIQEVKEAMKRMKEDCAHQVEMERAKVRDLEQQKQRFVEQLYAAEKRFQDKENELISYKESQLTKPEVRLQSELDLLKVEKSELERKLDTANKSKIHYKQQWGRALREVARLKQQEQAVAKERLKRQEQELEHMRLRYLAAEEKEVVKASERNELEDIKQELNRLKQQEEQKLRISESQHNPVSSQYSLRHFSDDNYSTHLSKETIEELDNRIAKLIEERDTLLQTGVYTTDDRIIVELDKQIRDAIASKG
ncbi:centrosomal protein of 120 kDa [Exaiptasia diaphana]|uniref:C2 domain-containing protein n=1 Tax=Exaiptasia diaphana TaxID=2652724 RepID=A0A913Y7S3_EXADI|nr:centrosomal protein of 120 kDa [Exaiptasia diaphana]KXJ28809.1 Centrosomal protein of 120 kDa [Exaiptasia diaphana]